MAGVGMDLLVSVVTWTWLGWAVNCSWELMAIEDEGEEAGEL